ncbi:MAG TPA: hypothetical protein VGG16_28145 [Streptosporangiaceae bacterium]
MTMSAPDASMCAPKSSPYSKLNSGWPLRSAGTMTCTFSLAARMVLIASPPYSSSISSIG